MVAKATPKQKAYRKKYNADQRKYAKLYKKEHGIGKAKTVKKAHKKAKK